MGGTDLELVKQLRESVSCRVVAAGGVSSVDEVVTLERMGCDVQLGMALYTGKVSLQDCFIGCLDWQKTGGLVPVIVQSVAGEVLMMGYSNQDALRKTFESGKMTFFSRTKNRLWTKGETSNHFLDVQKLRADCDRDTILATERLYATIADRFANPKPGSYTATLNDKRVREKVMEEAEELTEAEDKDEVIWEAADVLYFISVLMYKEGVTWQDVYNELDKRHKEK